MSSDSDSNHSLRSFHSDGGDLPSFPTFYSPAKPKECERRVSSSVSSPAGGITAALSAASVGTPEKKVSLDINLEHPSPHKSHSYKKALERSRKLSRKAEELGERIKVKTERDEKIDNYIKSGGVRALSKEWEESKLPEASLSDCGVNKGPGCSSTSHGDSHSFLPRKPPGQNFFINPPNFITELYPPGYMYEEDPTNQASTFANVEDHLLTQQDPSVLKMIICSEWLKLCYLHKSCPLLIWQWLFQIMCRSHDQELSRGAFRSLTSLIHVAKLRQDVSSILVPPLSDITDILVHLGAHPSSVKAGSHCDPMEEDSVFKFSSPMQNLSHMLQYVVMCLKCCHKECYSVQDIETLIVLLVRISLDHHVCGEPIEFQVSLCIAALVAAVSETQWCPLLVRLVGKITTLSDHHHDKLHVMYLMSGTSQRLHLLQRELCRKSLEQLTEAEDSQAAASSVRGLVRHVVEYFLSRQRSECFEDYYIMFSVFSMVALCIHPSVMEWPSNQEKMELSILLGTLCSKKIRDNPDHPERSIVKDLVIRLMLEVKSQKDKTMRQASLFT